MDDNLHSWSRQEGVDLVLALLKPESMISQSRDILVPSRISETAATILDGVKKLSRPRLSSFPNNPHAFPDGPDLSSGGCSKSGMSGIDIFFGESG